MKKLIFVLVLSLHFQVQAGSSLVAVNKGSGSVSFVSLETGEVKEVGVGYLPHEVAVNETHAFVSNYGHQHVRSSSLANSPGNTISMIDLSNFKLVKNIELGSGKCAPHGVATSKDSRFVYVTCEGQQEIAVIDAVNGQLVKKLRTNQPGSHMLVKDSKNRLFVTNFWIGTVSVIDTDTGELVKQIFTGRSTEGIGLSLDEKWLYVTVVESNEIVKISLENLEIKKRAILLNDSSPLRVEASNDGSLLVVTQAGRNSVALLDSETLKPIDEIPVGLQPIGLTLSRKSDMAYVANMKDESISIIDLSKRKRVRDFMVNLRLPDGLTIVE